MNPSNYSNNEIFKLTGTLPAKRIEKLLDDEPIISLLSDIEDCLSDAVSAMPGEDCFQDDIKAMTNFAKCLRGDNKEALLNIISKFTDDLSSMLSSVEYAVSEINKYSEEVTK